MEGAHELGECEKLEGYVCEECRLWYMEQEAEWAEAQAYEKEYWANAK